MHAESIEEIRGATFPLVRKGYDPGEVRKYLAELAVRLEQEGPSRPGSEAVRRELELMGERTAAILAQAEESAERMHAEAVREASAVLSKARQEAEATKRAADEYAAEVRNDAERYAEQAHSVAEDDLRGELAELTRRRDEIVADLGRMAREIERTATGGSVANGTPVAQSSEPASPASA